MQTIIQFKDGEMQLLTPGEADRYRSLSDSSLCEAVRKGDHKAALFLVFHRYGLTLSHLVDRFAAPECNGRLLSEMVSEIFVHFDRNGWHTLIPYSIDKFPNHLYVIERNLILRLRKRDFNVHGRSSMFTSDNYAEYVDRYLPADDPIGRVDNRNQVDYLLTQLSATRRFVLRKRRLEGYKSAEVAAMLPDFWDSIGQQHPVPMPTGAYVDNQLSRATRQLARC